jgi:hypothetical protein
MNSSRYFAFAVVLFAGSVLQAQPKGKVVIDVVVLQVSTGYKQSLSLSAAERAELFSALAIDPRAQVLTRSQLHISDGNKGQLDLGGIPFGRNPTTVRPAISIEMTPQVQNQDELLLHVQLAFQRVMQYMSTDGRSQPVIGSRRTTLNIRLRDGQMNVLDGSSMDPNTNSSYPGLSLFGEELMISLTPHIALSR